MERNREAMGGEEVFERFYQICKKQKRGAVPSGGVEPFGRRVADLVRHEANEGAEDVVFHALGVHREAVGHGRPCLGCLLQS